MLIATPPVATVSSASSQTHPASQVAHWRLRRFRASLAWLALASPGLVLAQVAPDLGTAEPYAILGTNDPATSGTVSCTDTGPGTVIDGDVGTTFTSITSDCTITGAIDAPVLNTVVDDFDAAFAAVNANNVCTGTIPIVTTTLAPGVYCSDAGTTIGAGVILTLSGSASDVWVFRVGTGGGGALTLTDAQVVMGGGADACNVYWSTAEATTLTRSDFVGTVLSGTAITMTDGAWFGRALATTDVTITNAAPLVFAGCGAGDTITVNKDFSDNNAAAVEVELTCTSGIVSNATLNASEAAPAVFQVGGSNPGATCTATETVPVGYTADQTDCVGVPLGGSCTIVNTLAGAVDGTITVSKNFVPDSAATVSVALTCTSGTVTATPLNASEAAPAVFNVTGASPGATCTATETVPAGYTANQTGCVNMALGGSCTITNTLLTAPLPPALIPASSTWALFSLLGLLALLGTLAIRRFTN